ncbi:MAG: right-handed parallel beta-helix repeat-containing protein [Geobacter sp.]|nr:right-handed parallel beta-helix repeat-containing protein [Geobacter sp.]
MTTIYRALHVCAIAVFVLVLFALPARDAYGEILAASTITFTSGAGFTGVPVNTAADGQGGSTDIAGITVEVYGIFDSDGTKLTADGVLEFHSDWSGVPPIVTWNGSGATYGMAIKSTGDTHFKLTSLNFNDWGEWEGDEWTIEAFYNDISQGTRTFNGSTDGTNVPLAQGGVLDGQFNNIDEVRIYKTDGTGSWFGINDIVIDNPVVNTAPTFVGATTTLTVSQNSGAADIKGLLHVSDADASQTETWTQSVAPNHGTLGFSGATASSGSTDITPGGTITYQPAAGYIGTDSFTVQVSDGSATATRQITVTVIPPLTVTSIARRTPAEAVTNADSLVFRVTFSTPVNNLSTGDFAVSGTTAIVTGVTSSDYMVCDATISGGNLASLNGTVTLGFAAGQNITDTAGNAFTNTTPTGTNDNTYTVDNTVSAPSTPDLAAASDSGSSSTDNITSVTTPTITGTAEADATVTLYDTDGTTVLGSATATGGNWSITSSALSAGAHTLTAKATDTAGNTSAASSGLSLTIDTTGPATTVATAAFSADTGTSATDFITNTAAQTISGTLSANLAAGEMVEVSLDNGSTWTAATATAGQSTWSLAGQTLIASNTLKVRVADTAGNIGTVYSQAYLLDQAAPTITSVGVPADATYAAGQNLDFTVNFSTNVTVTGTDSTLSLTIGAVSRPAAYQSKSATSITYRYTVQGGDIDNNGITVGTLTLNTTTIQDTAGNSAILTLNSVGSTTGVLVDTLTPTATAATSIIATGFIANWGGVTGATGYYLDVATDSGFTSLVTGYSNLDAGNVTSLSVTGLTAGTPYFYRVRAYSSAGTGDSSNTIALTTATTRIVITTSDSGAGSLRQIVADANPGDIIAFDSSLDGQVVTIASDLIIDKDLTISGPGAPNLIISGGDMTRIFTVNSGRTVHISGLTISHGKSFDGPAIFNSGVLTVANSTISGNYAQSSSGSGIYNNPGATLTVTGCTISGNTADALGGGIYNNNGTAAITNTTIFGNAALSGGGGMLNNSAGTLTVDNSTIAGNSGGGLINLSGGMVTIRNAIFWGSGSYISGVATISDSIVTNGCYPGSTCTNVSSADPLLGVLGNYGGNTGTIPLLAGSPAIDSGSCASGPATDQRGMSRPQDATCDMGAYERGVPAALTATAGTPQSTVINTAFATSLAARVVDSLGSVLDGISVTFTGPGSGAGIGAAGSAVTNSSGIATYGVSANGTAGSYTVTAAVSALSATYNLANNKGTATVSLGNLTATYDGTAKAATATTTPAGLTMALTYDGSASAPTNVGSYAVVAAVNDSNYNGTASGTLTINKGSQAIAFGTAPAVVVGGTGTVGATGGASTSPVLFSSTTTSVCTISGTTVTGMIAGTCTIAANQAGDANYDAAPQVTQDITVGKESQSITFAPLPPKYFGVAPFTISATATSGLPVAFASSNPAVATVSGSTVTIVGAGETTITASQPGNANFDAALPVSQNLTVTISTAPPTLTVSALPDGAATARTTQNISGTALDLNGISSLTVNGTSVTVNTDGSFSFPVQLVAGANSITVTATNNVGAVTSDVRTITLDITAPYLTVTFPPDNAAVAQNYVTVTGTVATIPGMIVTYTVNGSSPQTATLTAATFSFTANLTQGMNTIQISAVGSEGKTAQAKRTLSSLSPFSLAITSPDSDIRTVRDTCLLTGTVEDNTTPVAITVDMDGQSYHPAVVGGVFQQQLSLSDAGVYRVSVTGIDENSSSQTVLRNIVRTSGVSNPFTIVDALQALMMTVGVVPLHADQILRLDVAPMVNGISVGDGFIDIEDTIVILRMAVGLL